MKILNRIARYILRKELKLQEIAFETQKKLIHDYTQRFEEFEEQVKELRGQVYELKKQRRGPIISPLMLSNIVSILPDPNEVATGRISAKDLKDATTSFTENGKTFFCKIIKVIPSDSESKSSISGLLIHISEYNMTIEIPLSLQKMDYNVLGVGTEITTYFWDFYKSGIRLLNGKSWTMLTEFIKAQYNVLSTPIDQW